MISILSDSDDGAQWAVLNQLTEPSLDRIKTPERYAELRGCKDELERHRAGLEGEALSNFNVVFDRVCSALRDYEDADPSQIVNDMLNARHRA